MEGRKTTFKSPLMTRQEGSEARQEKVNKIWAIFHRTPEGEAPCSVGTVGESFPLLAHTEEGKKCIVDIAQDLADASGDSGYFMAEFSTRTDIQSFEPRKMEIHPPLDIDDL